MKKIPGSAIFLICIMVLMVVIIISSLQMQYFASKLLPLIIGSAVLLLAGIRLAKELSKRKAESKKPALEAQGSGGDKGELKPYLLSAAWIVGFFLGIYTLGFNIAIGLFIILYMKTHGTRWITAVIYAVLTPALLWFIFAWALKVDMYPGLIISAIKG